MEILFASCGEVVKIAVIPGDGIGPEVTREGVRVLEHLNQHSSLGLELVTFDWGADRYLATGVALPPGALDELREGYAAAVMVTNNLFGDLLTDLGAALEGGLGMAASANLNPGRLSMFEPIHGSASELAGRDVANPMGMILTAALMLRELGRPAEARQIEEAVTRSVAAGEGTPDIGGTLGTRAAGDAVLARLRAG